jgi:peptidyl-prolyl cis-trans isomerase C
MKMKLAITLAALALAWTAQAQISQYAVTVNDEGITRTFIQAQVDTLVNQRGINYGGITQPDAYKQMQREVVEQLIAQELLWQEAQRREFVADDEMVDARLEQIKAEFDSPLAFRFKIEESGFTETSYREDVTRKLSVQRMITDGIAPGISVSDEEVEDFYNENLERMQRPPEVNARHILITPASSEPDVLEAARQEIEAILAEIRNGADFETVAKERSQAPSAPEGGELGYFGRGQMVPSFEQAAFALAPGEVSEVVQTQFGYHIIQVEGRRGGETVAIEQVSDKIRAYLTQQKLQTKVETLVGTLRNEGDVEIFLNL